MGSEDTEACGRCSMTTVVSATRGGEDDQEGRDPFAGARIEVADADLRRASTPAVWLGVVTERLNALGERIAYGR